MKKSNHLTKVLLSMLVFGAGGMLVRPFVVPTPVVAQAQGRTHYAFGFSYAPTVTQYNDPDFQRTLGLSTDQNARGGYGTNLLDHNAVMAIVNSASTAGWQVHSITPANDPKYPDKYIVLFES